MRGEVDQGPAAGPPGVDPPVVGRPVAGEPAGIVDPGLGDDAERAVGDQRPELSMRRVDSAGRTPWRRHAGPLAGPDHRAASSTVVAIGFSQRTCLPARAAASTIGGWGGWAWRRTRPGPPDRPASHRDRRRRCGNPRPGPPGPSRRGRGRWTAASRPFADARIAGRDVVRRDPPAAHQAPSQGRAVGRHHRSGRSRRIRRIASRSITSSRSPRLARSSVAAEGASSPTR